MLHSICSQFMDDKRKILGRGSIQRKAAAGTANLIGKARELLRNDLIEWRAHPAVVGEHPVSARQRAEPHFQRLPCLRERLVLSQCPGNDSLHYGKKIPRPVTQFSEQKLLMFVVQKDRGHQSRNQDDLDAADDGEDEQRPLSPSASVRLKAGGRNRIEPVTTDAANVTMPAQKPPASAMQSMARL